jgi:hypothetical protein
MNVPTAEQVAAAIKNQNDMDRARRVAARLHERLHPTATRTLAQMEIYKQLHGAKP